MNLQEAECDSMDSIKLAQDRDRWWAVVNAGSIQFGEFFDYPKTC